MIQFNGFAGGLVGWIILILAYLIFFIGAWVVFNYFIWDVLVKHAIGNLKVYKRIIEFIWHRKKFYKWLNQQKEE